MIENEERSPEEPQEGESGTDSGTGQTVDPEDEHEDDKRAGDRQVDRDSEDSFPASDAPAW